MITDKEKAEVLLLFALVFSSRTGCLLGTQTPELQDRDRK